MESMRGKYLVVCRAIKYHHLNIVDRFMIENWDSLDYKHQLWLMRYAVKHRIIFGNRRIK